MLVYWIHNKEQKNIFEEGYIGITNNFNQRMFSHKSFSKKSDYPIYNAIKKYGWDNIVKEILLISDENYCKLIEKQLRPTKRIGWNLSEGGNLPPNFKGIKQSKEHLKNRCNALKGRVSGFLGKKHSESTKEKCRLINIGKPKSKESKLKNAIAHYQPIKINDDVYKSWQEASKITGIPMNSFSSILKGNYSKTGKYSWIKTIGLVI